VQEAYLRAVRYAHSFSGENPRAWILAIVCNTFFTWRKGNNPAEQSVSFDEELHCAAIEDGPEVRLIRNADAHSVTRAIEQLPPEFREVIVLREIEDLSYREIAQITGAPAGTVMSRLARARAHLRRIILQSRGAAA
jgi:RNA polymerase sigma factor (sigma-70 family)